MNPDTSAPDVLLAGFGDLNTQVGLRLSAQGLSVLGIRRRPERRRLPFQVIQRDLTESAGKALPAAESVVVALTADTSDAAGYERAYRETLRGLAAMLPEAPRRLVFVSSTSVLGEHGGKVVTEEIPPAAERQTAQVLLAAEQDAAELFDETVTVRPAGIYGRGRSRLIERVLHGRPADHGRITNRIHSQDLVTIIENVLQAQQPPALLHAADTEPAPMGEVLAFLAHRLGVPTPENSGDGTSTGKTLDTTRLRRMLGATDLRFSTFREGYAALLADER